MSVGKMEALVGKMTSAWIWRASQPSSLPARERTLLGSRARITGWGRHLSRLAINTRCFNGGWYKMFLHNTMYHICRHGIVSKNKHSFLSTVQTKMESDWENSPWILIVWCSKLVICPSSCAGIEFGQLHPSEIWQPWLSNFGNPEKQNSDSWVFRLPEQ